MATKNDVKGVSANRETPVVIPKPYAPERQFMSKADVLKAKAIEAKAAEAAKKAHDDVMKSFGQEPTPQAPPVKESEINRVRKALAHAQEKLDGNPESKNWKKKVVELSEQLEVLETA